jgi:hypothetical protein
VARPAFGAPAGEEHGHGHAPLRAMTFRVEQAGAVPGDRTRSEAERRSCQAGRALPQGPGGG